MGVIGLSDLIGMIVGLVLTLCVFSFIFGDNVLFRLAIHIFIGVSAGYAAVIVYYNVIFPQLILPLLTGSPAERMLMILPLVLCLMLLAKATRRFSWLGTPAIAYLVGVGAAAAVGGALLGTIFPQITASWNLFDLQTLSQTGVIQGMAKGGLILLGTLTTLVYFHFGARSRSDRSSRRSLGLEIISSVGKGFIVITFGAMFAGIYAAALTAWVERWNFMILFIFELLRPSG
ncbi:MAG: hypothetical protein AB1894_24255 [Chloroflexota bacterium]